MGAKKFAGKSSINSAKIRMIGKMLGDGAGKGLTTRLAAPFDHNVDAAGAGKLSFDCFEVLDDGVVRGKQAPEIRIDLQAKKKKGAQKRYEQRKAEGEPGPGKNHLDPASGQSGSKLT